MKKRFESLAAALLLSAAAACLLPAETHWRLSAGIEWQRPHDRLYRLVYGSRQIYPSLQIAWFFHPVFYGWAGYGYAAAKGTTSFVLAEETRVRRHIVSAGAGFQDELGGRLGCLLELGAGYHRFREEALDWSYSGGGWGPVIRGGLTWTAGKHWLILLTAGYSGASAEAGSGGERLRLGGFQMGLSLGRRW